MPVNYKGFKTSIEPIAKKIFETETVTKRPYYINSTSWQRRRPLRATKSPKHSGQIGTVLLNPEIKKFPEYFNIGPYEIGSLIAFINCDDGYLFFQGGSKSGKSSLLCFLERYCAQYFSDEINRFAHDSEKMNDFCVQIIRIDIANYDSNLSEEGEYSDEQKKKAREEFFTELRRTILAKCMEKKVFTNEHIYLDYCYQLYNNFECGEHNGDTISGLISEVSLSEHWPEEERWRSLGIKAKYRIFQEILKKIEKPEDSFVATIAPLWFYSNSKNVNGTEYSLILVIDNIDPQPTFFQQNIANCIRRITTTNLWKKRFGKNKFNIVLPVRLSTFKRRIGQMGNGFKAKEHEAFYPSDVLFHRLNYFFLTEGKYTKLAELSDEYARAVILRLYSLWSHLSDRKSYFRTMLDSLCGTNIEHANNFAQNWCACEDFDLGNFENKQLMPQFYNRMGIDAANSMLYEYWLSVLRAFDWCMDSYYKPNQEKAILNVSIMLSKSIGEIFRDNRILCYPDKIETLGIRRQIAHKLKKNILTALKKQVDEVGKYQNILKKQISMLTKILSKHIYTQEEFRNFITLFKATISTELMDNLSEQCCTLEGYNEEMSCYIAKWLDKLLDFIDEGIDIIKFKEKPIVFWNEEGHPYSKSFMIFAPPKISRFDAGKHLLEKKGISFNEAMTAENVYSVGKRTKPVGLHVLYALYSSEHFSMRTGDMTDLLELYGYHYDNEILPVLQSLVRIDRRLIFCDVNDYEYGIKRVIKAPNMVMYLSNAGKAYIRNLITTPPYLQWSLLSREEIVKQGNMLTQINTVKTKMETLIDDEIESLKRIKGNPDKHAYLNNIVPKYYCATLDALVRSLDYYIPGLIGHHKNITSARGKTTKTEDLMRNLIHSCETNIRKVLELFDLNIDTVKYNQEHSISNWYLSLEWCKKHLEDQIKLKFV